MRTAILAAWLVVGFTPSAGSRQDGTVAVYGQGVSVSCGAWTEDRATAIAGGSTRAANMSWTWVVGYVSGAGVWFDGRIAETDSDAIRAFVDKHCRENPLDRLVDASNALVRTLNPKDRLSCQ